MLREKFNLKLRGGSLNAMRAGIAGAKVDSTNGATVGDAIAHGTRADGQSDDASQNRHANDSADANDSGSARSNGQPDARHRAQTRTDARRDARHDSQGAASPARKPADEGQAAPRADAQTAAYRALRTRLHSQLLERVDLTVMAQMPIDRLKDEVRVLVERLIGESGVAINSAERKNLVREIQNEVTGLGPLEPLLADPTISDILVNSSREVYIERRGKLELTGVRFDSDDHLMKIIDKIVSRVGRRIDESSPMVDARLPDGSRVNAIIPPLAIDGPSLSIRRFGAAPLRMEDLITNDSLTPEIAELLHAMVKARLNVLISGGTGSGKTTMLNVMSAAIPTSERIVTIEDAAELQLQQRHIVRLETRPSNIEGRGEINQRMLVRNALRMRPDRIILGEVRGAEAFDMLQAMNTGHDGSMATVHANTTRDAISRLENMLGMAGIQLGTRAIRQQIASALTVVVQVSRQADGRRRLVNLAELTGMEGDIITMQDIVGFRQTGIDGEGRVLGNFMANGVRPRFLDRISSYGIKLPASMFDPNRILG